MQETKVTLIYFGLLLFVFLSFVPWVVNRELALLLIQVLAVYGAVILAFLSGFVWGWDDGSINNSNLWFAIGFSLMGFCVILLSINALEISLILLIVSFQGFLSFEKHTSKYFKNNNKYAEARKLITNLVTICCITSIAFIYNPYI